jgi:phosphohistidine phosphatase
MRQHCGQRCRGRARDHKRPGAGQQFPARQPSVEDGAKRQHHFVRHGQARSKAPGKSARPARVIRKHDARACKLRDSPGGVCEHPGPKEQNARMPDLLVVRHAIAFERDPARWPNDALRPLTPQGKRRFRRAARGIARWFPEVDLHLTSPLVRARQTAKILTETAGWPEAIVRNELKPHVEPAATLNALSQLEGERLVVIGHEPHLGRLVALCVAEPAELHLELKKGAVVLIRFKDRLRARAGMLVALVPPKVLREMA